jgi:hypothetical protein
MLEERADKKAAMEEAREQRRLEENPEGEILLRQPEAVQDEPEAAPELTTGDAEYPYLEFYGNWALTSLALGSLEYVEGTILFWYNPEVTSLRFPALIEVGWDLEILENDLLDDLRAPLLESVGERGSGSLAVFQNPVLPSFWSTPVVTGTTTSVADTIRGTAVIRRRKGSWAHRATARFTSTTTISPEDGISRASNTWTRSTSIGTTV